MDHNLRYLAEEVAENHAAGLVSRREALRHMGVLGLSAATASAILAACGGGDDDDGATQPAPTDGPVTTASGPATTTAAVPVQDVTYPGRDVTLMGVYAPAASPRGAVLVVHENRGITDFVRTFTGRLAGSGYTALAVDLLSAQGGTATFSDPAQLQSALQTNATERATEDMKSTLEELGRRAPGQKLGAVGFCFGGNMVWQLLSAGEPPALAAAAPFYGSPQNPDFTKSKAAVLAVYAENDGRVNATRETARSGLEQARLTHEIKTYPGVGHAFMNHTGNNYNEAQATAAYNDLVAWFGRHLR
ncbi:MAG: dienelactone hydrolase family protein [Acidimicrobiia bacterium]